MMLVRYRADGDELVMQETREVKANGKFFPAMRCMVGDLLKLYHPAGTRVFYCDSTYLFDRAFPDPADDAATE